MKGYVKSLIVLVALTALVFVYPSTASAIYDNKNVYTVIDGIKYYMNGTKLMKNDNELYDFTLLRYKSEKEGFEVTADMAKTMMMTDLTHDTWNGHPIIYGVAIMFKTDQDGTLDSPDAESEPSKVGTPYMAILSYNVDGVAIEGYYQDIDVGVEGNAKLDDLFVTLGPEASKKEDMETWYYNWGEKVIYPRIIMSVYKANTMYILYGDQKVKQSNSRCVQVFSYDTSRTNPENPFKHQLYLTLNYLKTTLRRYSNNYYQVDPNRFYIKENGNDRIVVYNFGEIMAIAIESDISTYGRPKHAKTHWQETKLLPIPRQN